MKEETQTPIKWKGVQYENKNSIEDYNTMFQLLLWGNKEEHENPQNLAPITDTETVKSNQEDVQTKYNTINELTPFALNTSSSYNNSYNGKVNTAFAKIILDDNEANSCRNNSSKINKIIYNQLVKNIDRLKFKLRFHSGLLLDLADNDFHFTLVFYTVKQSTQHLRLD